MAAYGRGKPVRAGAPWSVLWSPRAPPRARKPVTSTQYLVEIAASRVPRTSIAPGWSWSAELDAQTAAPRHQTLPAGDHRAAGCSMTALGPQGPVPVHTHCWPQPSRRAQLECVHPARRTGHRPPRFPARHPRSRRRCWCCGPRCSLPIRSRMSGSCSTSDNQCGAQAGCRLTRGRGNTMFSESHVELVGNQPPSWLRRIRQRPCLFAPAAGARTSCGSASLGPGCAASPPLCSPLLLSCPDSG